jgi:DNA-binding response OmpR family regulator
MEHTKETPILMVSASRTPEDKHLSSEAGCDGYITKPIDVDQISQQIAAFLIT